MADMHSFYPKRCICL